MTRQVSELYRRGVVRPLNNRAREHLESFCAGNSIRCEWLPILDETEFATIWKSGLLQAIGDACSLYFTDYEEILIRSDDIPKAVLVAKEFLQHPDGEWRVFAESLLLLLVDAQASGMPVLFVL